MQSLGLLPIIERQINFINGRNIHMTSKKVKRVVGVFLACLLLAQTVFAATPSNETDLVLAKVEQLTNKSIALGKVVKDQGRYTVNGIEIPTYMCENISYLQVSDLRQVGGNVVWDPAAKKAIIYDLKQPISASPKFEELKKDQTAYLGRDTVYINHQEVPAIYVEGRTLIPAKWISLLANGGENNLFNIRRGSSYLVTEEVQVKKEIKEEIKEEIIEEEMIEEVIEEEMIEEEMIEEVVVEEEMAEEALVDAVEENTVIAEEIEEEVIEEVIEEITIETIEREEKRIIKGINIWFDGKDYIERDYNFHELPSEEFPFYQDRQFRLKDHYDYVGFVITEIDGMVNSDAGLHKAWLKNPSYFTLPVVEANTELFPASLVQGIMRTAAGGFAKGDQVYVRQASSGRVYHLTNKSGNLVTVPWNSVAIQKAPVTREQASDAEIEAFANSKNLSSATNYLVWTDIYRQRTYVFQGSKNNWKLIKNFLSITGKDTTPTPRGTYVLNAKVPSFGSGYKAKNAYGFIGTTYLYHSVLYDNSGSYVLSNNNTPGYKNSAGCIRLAPADSLWLYNTIPRGTTAYIN